MKKVLVLILVLTMAVGGCATFKQPCSEASQNQLATANSVLKGIQQFYTPLQALILLIPVYGNLLELAIPVALAAADSALQNLGTIIATNCANDQQITLAKIILNTIENIFANPTVQKVLASPSGQANLKMLKAMGK